MIARILPALSLLALALLQAPAASADSCTEAVLDPETAALTVGDDDVGCGGVWTSASTRVFLTWGCVRDHSDSHPYTCGATYVSAEGYCTVHWHDDHPHRDWQDSGDLIISWRCTA